MKTKKYRVNGKLKNQKPKGNSRKTSKNLTKLKCKKKKKKIGRQTYTRNVVASSEKRQEKKQYVMCSFKGNLNEQKKTLIWLMFNKFEFNYPSLSHPVCFFFQTN